MKRWIVLLAALCFFINACAKKERVEKEVDFLEEVVQNASEANLTLSNDTATTAPPALTPEDNVNPLAPEGVSLPQNPSPKDIQTALKNAGFYTGRIDGIIGPKTKKAIREFQEKNGLAVDGKVGPKTWERLKPYLEKQSVT